MPQFPEVNVSSCSAKLLIKNLGRGFRKQLQFSAENPRVVSDAADQKDLEESNDDDDDDGEDVRDRRRK
ncbi:uncharacterized [Tachysurus ichikawai]